MSEQQIASAAMGVFDLDNQKISIDRRQKSRTYSSFPTESSLANNMQGACQMVFKIPQSREPCRIQGAKLRLIGKITNTSAHTAIVPGTPIALSEMWGHCLFDGCVLKIGDIETERIDNGTFQSVLKMKTLLSKSANSLKNNIYNNSGVTIRSYEDTPLSGESTSALEVLYTGLPDEAQRITHDYSAPPGKYTAETDNRLIKSDYTFEYMIPLADIFESLASIHSFMRCPRMELKFNWDGSRPTRGICIDDTKEAANWMKAFVIFDKASIEMENLILDTATEIEVAKQYDNTACQIPTQICEVKTDVIPAGSNYFTKTIPFISSKFGDEVLCIGFTDPRYDVGLNMVTTKVGVADASAVANWLPYSDPAKLVMPRIKSIKLDYAGHNPIDMQDLVPAYSTGTTLSHENISPSMYQRLYQMFKDSHPYFGTDPSETIDYHTWRLKYPFICIRLDAFHIPANAVTPQINLTIALDTPTVRQIPITFMLLKDYIFTYNWPAQNNLGELKTVIAI